MKKHTIKTIAFALAISTVSFETLHANPVTGTAAVISMVSGIPAGYITGRITNQHINNQEYLKAGALTASVLATPRVTSAIIRHGKCLPGRIGVFNLLFTMSASLVHSGTVIIPNIIPFGRYILDADSQSNNKNQDKNNATK